GQAAAVFRRPVRQARLARARRAAARRPGLLGRIILEPTPPRTLWELYWGFLSIGARSFGGVLPWAHRVMVEERRWIAPADFAEVLALCQFLPGPNVGNVSVVLGRRWFGPVGSVVAFAGLMALPLVWVFGLALLYADFSSN